MKHLCFRAAAAAVAVLAVLAVVAAPTAAHADPGSAWRVTPYLWIAGFDGTIGTAAGGGGGEPDLDFDHFWDNMRLGGAMLNVGWRRDRWRFIGDWTYARVRSDSASRVPALYDSVEGEISGHVVQAFGGYGIVDRADSQVDLIAGARYYDLGVKLDLHGSGLPDAHAKGSDEWLDAVAGVRWTTRFADRWQAQLLADAGAGGSDWTWEALGTLGYEYDWGSVVGGWRYLKADYDSDAYRLDAALAGPFVGVSLSF